MRLLTLRAHPATPCAWVRSIAAAAERAAQAVLALRYRIEGELARLRIPAPRPRQAGDRLWQHTCCEVFVAASGSRAYREFNFSPSGEWAGFAFTRYREGGPAAAADPGIAVVRGDDFLELQARIPVEPGPLQVGLSAVIEDGDGGLSYWALAHPAPKPDFHHRQAFVLELD